jgi:hypothetical protein
MEEEQPPKMEEPRLKGLASPAAIPSTVVATK